MMILMLRDVKDAVPCGRTNPFVFTEQGIAMLASVLHTDIAIEISIRIIRSFVKMRNYINYHQNMLPNNFLLIEKKVDENTKRINELFDKFDPKEIIKEIILGPKCTQNPKELKAFLSHYGYDVEIRRSEISIR